MVGKEAARNHSAVNIVGISVLSGGPKSVGFPKHLWIFQIARILCQKPEKSELVNDHPANSDTLFFFDIGHFLQGYQWPGNVRELENVLERGVIESSGPKLRLVDELKTRRKDLPIAPKTLEAVEREHIVRVLNQTQWKVSGRGGAAAILGLNRSTLRARMRKLSIVKL